MPHRASFFQLHEKGREALVGCVFARRVTLLATATMVLQQPPLRQGIFLAFWIC